jgi:hypothetical protein
MNRNHSGPETASILNCLISWEIAIYSTLPRKPPRLGRAIAFRKV